MQNLLLKSGGVIRYHSNPELAVKLQTNSQHQWNCAAILLQIFGPTELARRPNLLMHALFHDAGELLVGDLPAEFKRKNEAFANQHRAFEKDASGLVVGILPEMDEFEIRVLKFADLAESLIFILQNAQDPLEVPGFENCISNLSSLCSDLPQIFWNFATSFINPMITKKVGIHYQLIPF